MNDKKYVFIAGGIGITPFRSIIKNLLDTGQKKAITLFYFASTEDAFLFRDIFTQAEKEIGLKIVYVQTDTQKISLQKLCKKYISDIHEPIYYIAGPQAMVESYRTILLNMGIDYEQMKEDSFTGWRE